MKQIRQFMFLSCVNTILVPIILIGAINSKMQANTAVFYKPLYNDGLYLQITNYPDHYQCHDIMVAHPEVEELIYTIGQNRIFAVNFDPRIKEEKDRQIFLRGPNNAINLPKTPMAIAASKQYLAVGYHFGLVEFYDINKRSFLFSWETMKSMVNYLDFYYVEGRSILLTANNDNCVTAYDVDNKNILYEVDLPDSANGVKISPDNRVVAVTSDTTDVYFFSPNDVINNGKINVQKTVKVFESPIAQSISWDPTSRYIAFACEGDKACVVYDTQEERVIRRYIKPYPVRIVKFNHLLEAPLLAIGEDIKTLTVVDYVPDFQESFAANDPNMPCVRHNIKNNVRHGPYHVSGICFSKSGTTLHFAYCTTADTYEDGGDFYYIKGAPIYGCVKSLKDMCIQFVRSTLAEHRVHYKGIRDRVTKELFDQINIKTT